jgi:3-oxoacyl-[acyl-carrier protein] reductase
MTPFNFIGKTVLVTGSSRGIGATCLRQFAQAGGNCILHFWDDANGANRRDAEQLAAEVGERVLLEAADVRDAAEVEALMKRIQTRSGGLDILVNNAGIIRDRTLKKMTLDEWHAVIQTNLTGVFHCCKFGSEILRDNGRIVNISSIAATIGFPGQTNYAAAKAGVIGITKVLAKELARRGITVNAVAPGVIQTAMLGEVRPEVQAEYLKQIPIGRIGRPEDVANAILFLASEPSSYITGHVLPVTGGWA